MQQIQATKKKKRNKHEVREEKKILHRFVFILGENRIVQLDTVSVHKNP